MQYFKPTKREIVAHTSRIIRALKERNQQGFMINQLKELCNAIGSDFNDVVQNLSIIDTENTEPFMQSGLDAGIHNSFYISINMTFANILLSDLLDQGMTKEAKIIKNKITYRNFI